MQKTDNTPFWVFMAFSVIDNRKQALWLIWACVLFTLYCIPWPLLIDGVPWLSQVFLIDDWSWVAMMVPITAWYVLALRWVESNGGWARFQSQ